jgi:UDP-GlcNAc:undecaprenyl-phosphate GlcNAc-1-phosphate transferase
MDLGQVLASAVVAFSIATVFMLALRPVAFGIRLIDAPGGRKFHEGEIPIIGGIAMYFGIFAATVFLQLDGMLLLSILVASTILVAIGVLDDRFHIPPAARLLSQIAAILLMYFGAGLGLSDIGDPFGFGTIYTGRLSLAVTMLIFVSMINAYNFVDGADGLAGSITLIGLLAVTMVVGVYEPVGAFALTVAAATVGFLIFNFPAPFNHRVRAFMGDAGSTFLGFTMAWVTLSISQGPGQVISPVHCLWFAAIPIFDFFACFTRRLLKRKSPFTPGRDHFHHILMRGRFGVRQTLGILTGLQLLYAMVGLAGYFSNTPDWVMFAAWSVTGLTQIFVIRLAAKHHRRWVKQRTANRLAKTSG